MSWYKSAQIADVSMPQRAAKYHNGQNVIVYDQDSNDSRTGVILSSQYYAGEDEYAYQIRFDEPNKIFKEDNSYKERDIITY